MSKPVLWILVEDPEGPRELDRVRKYVNRQLEDEYEVITMPKKWQPANREDVVKALSDIVLYLEKL